jgi:hypothetical protein
VLDAKYGEVCNPVTHFCFVTVKAVKRFARGYKPSTSLERLYRNIGCKEMRLTYGFTRVNFKRSGRGFKSGWLRCRRGIRNSGLLVAATQQASHQSGGKPHYH